MATNKRPIGVDPHRIRRATQGLQETGPEKVDGKTIVRNKRGELEVAIPQRPAIKRLRDLSHKDSLRDNLTIAEIPDAATAPGLTPIQLRDDIVDNLLPVIRDGISTLTERLNCLTDRVNEITR